MRRFLFPALICLILLLFAFPASAERTLSHPVDPHPMPDIIMTPKVYRASEGEEAVVISNPTPLRLVEGTKARWTLTVRDGVEDVQFIFGIYQKGEDLGNGNFSLNGVYEVGPTDSTVFEYTPTVTGEIYVIVFTVDADGNETRYDRDFYVNTAGGTSQLEQKVASVAAECLASGASTDYDKALWLHDWLTNNAHYDLTYSYYGADGVLLLGTGVCDSYSKAYELLLNAVGVESRRCTGTAGGGGHAWNAVCMDGIWAQVDCTWDDPTSGDSDADSVPVSGYESHDYFGLSDKLMQIDHTYKESVHCDSLARNYSLLSGEVADWSENYVSYFQDALNSGNLSPVLTYVEGEDPWWAYCLSPDYYGIRTELMLRYLEDLSWSAYGGIAVPLALTYDADSASLSAEIDYSSRTLELPGDTARIEEEAFADTDGYLCVKITGGEEIGPRAFADCDSLIRIELPASVEEIAADAFAGTKDHLTIICPNGAPAAAYAEANSIPHSEN